jgi:hypothetical protein
MLVIKINGHYTMCWRGWYPALWLLYQILRRAELTPEYCMPLCIQLTRADGVVTHKTQAWDNDEGGECSINHDL